MPRNPGSHGTAAGRLTPPPASDSSTVIWYGSSAQGAHTVFIGQVEQVKARDGRPLLFYGGRYRKLETD